MFIAGSILVPETSELKIVGSGKLSVIPQSNQKFAIGCDLNHSYGNIGIYLDNRLDIRTAAEKSVAIGGGYNRSCSRIDIRTKNINVDISGKKVLGIGCYHSEAIVDIDGSLVSFRLQCAEGIAMGSFGKGIKASVNVSRLRVKAEGNIISGIYAVEAAEGIVSISESDINMKYNGKNIHGIGFESGGGKINVSECSCDIKIEGIRCFAIGSGDKKAEISISKSSGSVHVAADNPYVFYANEKLISISDSDISGYEGS